MYADPTRDGVAKGIFVGEYRIPIPKNTPWCSAASCCAPPPLQIHGECHCGEGRPARPADLVMVGRRGQMGGGLTLTSGFRA